MTQHTLEEHVDEYLSPTRSRDEKIQSAIGRATKHVSRRTFMHRALTVAATGFAASVTGPLGNLRSAFASTYACALPCGVHCSGCSSSADCPSGYVNCTETDPFAGELTVGGCCIYASSWWYTSGSVGDRHRCRDCRLSTCPCCCKGSCCAGVCGCRSTVHF